ncbi:hypothetical protein RhiirA1_498473 [Rhizophagus irregularis]|uniref:Uncharacterized protein n=1 Tax=Rhizophagus irregularis TaxID=588596 RepID=A0A2N0R1X4_9GLOM|nr:hypothetical protein RhiirA1_498473 [Rhizophagus irregularis]
MSEQRFRNHIIIMTKESEQPGEIINERIMNGGRENLSQTNMSKNFVVNEELISVTEGKQKDFVAGFMELMQLESSYQTNVRKRKASEAFNDEFDYLYEIVTTDNFTEKPNIKFNDNHKSITKTGREGSNGNFKKRTPLRTSQKTSNKSVGILSEDEQVYEATDGLTGLTLNKNNKVEEFNKLNEVFSNRVNRRVYNKRIINGQGEREEVIASK